MHSKGHLGINAFMCACVCYVNLQSAKSEHPSVYQKVDRMAKNLSVRHSQHPLHDMYILITKPSLY